MAEQKGIPSYVTNLTPVTEQVGGHVLKALQSPEVVAVVTTLVPGMGTDRVVSMPVDAARMGMIQALLAQVHDTKQPDPPKCVGFHCRLEDEAAGEE